MTNDESIKNGVDRVFQQQPHTIIIDVMMEAAISAATRRVSITAGLSLFHIDTLKV